MKFISYLLCLWPLSLTAMEHKPSEGEGFLPTEGGLPGEVWTQILSYLPDKDLARSKMVSRSFKEYVEIIEKRTPIKETVTIRNLSQLKDYLDPPYTTYEEIYFHPPFFDLPYNERDYDFNDIERRAQPWFLRCLFFWKEPFFYP